MQERCSSNDDRDDGVASTYLSKWNVGNSCTRIALLVNTVYKLNVSYSHPRCCCCHDFCQLLSCVPGLCSAAKLLLFVFIQEAFHKIVSLMFALVVPNALTLFSYAFESRTQIWARLHCGKFSFKLLLLIAWLACNDIVVILLRINTRVLKCTRACNIIYINVNSTIV